MEVRKEKENGGWGVIAHTCRPIRGTQLQCMHALMERWMHGERKGEIVCLWFRYSSSR